MYYWGDCIRIVVYGEIFKLIVVMNEVVCCVKDVGIVVVVLGVMGEDVYCVIIEVIKSVGYVIGFFV